MGKNKIKNNKIQKINFSKEGKKLEWPTKKVDPNAHIKPEFFSIKPFKFVKEYTHIFEQFVKKRWIGQQLLNLLSTEFQSHSKEYYIQAIKDGNITINNEIKEENYILQHSDKLKHITTRLEPPVLDIMPKIIFQDENLIIINKPASYAVHATNGQQFNTLHGILIHQMNFQKDIQFLHRLDKVTSGLVMISKQKVDANEYHKQNIEDKMKIYLAKVEGKFPDQKNLIIDNPIYTIDQKNFIHACCEKNQIQELNAKESKTVVNRIWYDSESNTSLLQCIPLTGRTHQIRVHLKHKGFPILNDVLYGGKNIGNNIVDYYWPQLKNKNSVKYSDYNENQQQKNIINNETKNKKNTNEKQDISELEKNSKIQVIDQKQQNLQKITQENNLNKIELTEESNRNYKDRDWDFREKVIEICLHSYQYKIQGKIYKTELPYWAQQKNKQNQEINIIEYNQNE